MSKLARLVNHFAFITVALWIGALLVSALLPSTLANAQSLSDARKADALREEQRLSSLAEDPEALESALKEAREAHQIAERKRQALHIEDAVQAVIAWQLDERMGEQSQDLKALLDALKQHSRDVRNTLGDESWLTLGDASLPPRLDEALVLEQRHIEHFVDSLASLSFATGHASRLTLPVADASGDVAPRDIIRLGDFAAFTQAGLLQPGSDPEHLTLQPRTPSAVAQWLKPYLKGESRTLAIDSTQGRVFSALQQQPTLMERFHQGGYVGYVVVALGATGLLVAFLQYAYLVVVSMKVRQQRQSPHTLQRDNPLGRVLLRFERLNKHQPPEALEARLDEAVLAELPRLERGQPVVKLLAGIAPLLGLLGTVTGMIVTFQAITVFGTGDPQLMAGGISQALVTTVLGLVTAVPLLFAQTALSTRSRALTQVIEGQASAALADHLDVQHGSHGTSHHSESGHDHATSLA